MAVERPVLLRFMLLYCALFSAFGCASPFLPAFLAGRGLGPEELGLVLGGATALRLVCGPVAGRIADRLQAFRAELAVCAILAATAALVYLVVHRFWTVVALTLGQAAPHVLGSNAMSDSLDVNRWSEAGISPATIGLLWSDSVTAEVLVFLLIGTTLLRVLKPTGALACAASCGVLRWGVMAQTTDVTA